MWISARSRGGAWGRAGRLAGLLLVLTGLLVAVPDAPTVDAATPAKGCGTARKAGRHVLPVPLAGKTYQVTTFLPKGYSTGHRLSLVLNLHGSSHDGQHQEKLSVIEPVANQHHFIVAAPNGGIRFDRGYAWNIPGTPLADGSLPPRNARDDVAFLAATVRAAASAYCVDSGRVYVTGHSGGARMASAFTCEPADLVAALAAVSGLRAGRPDPDDPRRPDPDSCRPSRPVPVLSFHGMADELNPYYGGGGPYWGYSVPTAVRTWSRLDRCATPPLAFPARPHVLASGSLVCAQSVETISYAIFGAGHTWPGSPYNDPVEVAGVTNREIDATRTIWSFFAKYHLPAR
jgi:polyhydroxybutyrate depolymerase